MLALVLVVGHLILTRLGIAYRAVTGYYNSGGKSLCNEDADTDSSQRSRNKSMGLGIQSQATQFNNVQLSMASQMDSQLNPTMTVQSIDTNKRTKMSIPASSFAPIASSGYMPGLTATNCPPGMLSNAYAPGMSASGYPPELIPSLCPDSALDPGLSMMMQQDENCGPAISPSRTVTGPNPECIETANWRSNRGRCTPASGYMPDPCGTAMATSYCGQDVSGCGAMGKTTVGSAYYDSQLKSAQGSSCYGGQTIGLAGYEQSSQTRGTRQSANAILSMGGQMSQTNGDILKKLGFQFRPSKIPSAYRFPRPDDIPCSNEDFPCNQPDPQYNLAAVGGCGYGASAMGASAYGTSSAMGATTLCSGYGSGSRFSYNAQTPRTSPPRSVISQRPPSMYKTPSGPTTYGTRESYLAEDMDDLMSVSQNYQAQLGGVSSGAVSGGLYGETVGVGSMPQATSALSYGLAGPSRDASAFTSAYPSRQSAFAAVPPSQSAFSSGKSGYLTDNAGSRITGARRSFTRDNKPIRAYCCGRPSGFDDGPLPRPPKRKSMSMAEDFAKSRASGRKSPVVAESRSPSTTPSSISSPENEFSSPTISQMPPTSASRAMSPSRQISRQPTSMPASGYSSPQKQNRQTSGLYSVNPSGIRSVSEQDVQQVVTLAPSVPNYSSTPLSRMTTTTAPPLRRPVRRNTAAEMDCTNTDQFQ